MNRFNGGLFSSVTGVSAILGRDEDDTFYVRCCTLLARRRAPPMKVGDAQLCGTHPPPMAFDPLSLLILKFRGRSCKGGVSVESSESDPVTHSASPRAVD